MRDLWIHRRIPFMNNTLEKLVFLDETSLNTKLTKQTGWSPLGDRLYDYIPHGHWHTQTFVAGLRCHSLTAPWVLNKPMNKKSFEIYVETQLAPTLNKGDVVVLDNLSSHKSKKAANILKDVGAWFLFLPPYSPDLNPIEMAFSKLKSHLRKACARTYDQVWKAVGDICDLFSVNECRNYFRAVGCEFT